MDNNKLGKGLAKRTLKDDEDLNKVIFKEIEQISKHNKELKDIDYSTHHTIFYSTSITIESIKHLYDLFKNPVFEELEITNILKLFNIGSIAWNGNVGDYSYHSIYLLNKIY